MKRTAFALLAVLALGAPAARAADADVTGLVPTVWFDFETQPDAAGLGASNKGSAGLSFSHEGTKTYQTGATNGWAFDTSKFTPWSAEGSFSTAGGAFTLSLVMNLGTTQNGITLNLRNGAGQKDLIVRRGSSAGSLVVGCGPWKASSTTLLGTTFPDGDSAWHLVSVVARETGMELYVDGVLADATTAATLWSDSGRASQFQFGSHLNGVQSGEAKFGGCIDDLRIHDAALAPGQMAAIAAEYGLSANGYIAVLATEEPTVGTNSFSTSWTLALSPTDAADAALVYGTDAALSSPATNALGAALAPGRHTASLSGLAPGTDYWWKIVASNGVAWAETPVASFRTSAVLAETDFAWRVPVTLAGYAGASTLTNFPVLVRLAAGSPAGFDYADCAEGGADLRFADADGVVLPHEIDTWDTNGTSFVWVRVPRLSGTDTRLVLCYGSDDPGGGAAAAGVWKPYTGVWHMGEASGGVADATGHGLDATPMGDTANSVALPDGPVGNARRTATSAAKGYLSVPDYNRFNLGGSFTMSGWVKLAACTGYPRIFSRKTDYKDANGWEMEMSNGSTTAFSARGSGNSPSYSGSFSPALDAAWSHVALVYDDATLTVYQNGAPVQTGAITAATDNGLALSIGCNSNGSETYAQGAFDECRLLGGAASADWVKAEYDSAADPAAFAVLGPVESTDVSLPRFGGLSASDANGTATFAVALAVPGFGGAVPTAVSVFYGTDGETWTELPLGATNEAATLAGPASGLTGNVRYLWYAVASATQDGATRTTTSATRSFVAKAVEPAGDFRSFTATVDWDGAPVGDVPVLLRLSGTAVRGFDYGDVTASGLEIVGADGHLLPFEVDTWNTNGESLVWVLVPDYRDGASFAVRYGTDFANAPCPASEVWAGYKGVWHMESASPADVSGSGNNGTAAGAATNAPGRIGSAVSLPAKTAYVACGTNQDNSQLAPGFTVDGWANFADLSGYHALFGKNRFVSIRSNGGGEIQVTTPGKLDHNMKNLPLPAAGTWWHFALTFRKNATNGCKLYLNGALAAQKDAGDIENQTDPTEMWLGRNEWGDDQNFKGLLDEMRLRAVVRSAEGIAAEYHAVADESALVCSAVASSDETAPVLGVPSVARNADGTFTVSVAVSENAPDTIVCAVGGTSFAMAPADAAVPTTYSATVSGLAPGTYTATVRATSVAGTVVSSACPTVFHAGALVVEKLSDADEGSLAPGVFRISRADADAAGLPALTFDVAFSGDGLAAVLPPGISTLTIPAGETSVEVSVVPDPSADVHADAELVLAVSGTNVGLPSSAALTVVDAPYDIAVRYVSSTGDDANHGGTPEAPKLTVGAAVASLANVAQSRTCTVHVAPGLYPIEVPIVLSAPVRVLGDDPDPARAVVSNTVGAGWTSGNHRVFTINHPDALVANLTMQDGSVWGDWSGGGNFLVDTAGGTVSNCIVEAGHIQYGGHVGGGGARLEAGLVTHTVFRRNYTVTGSSVYGDGAYRAGVLMLTGSARAENCLLVDNPQSAETTIARLDGKATMRNCTIADSGLSRTNDQCKVFTPLRINSANATVVNTVVAGVTNTIDGASCPPTGSGVSNFLDGAFDGDASELPEGTVTGTIDEFFPRHGDAAAPFEARYRPEAGSPLRDAGADYAPMSALDLSGRQPRHVGAAVDIGCYEGEYLCVEAAGEPEIGLDLFVTGYLLGSDVPADVRIVWSADASFASASTNTVATGATNGVGEASIGGLETDAEYWWKLVADNGSIAVETAPAAFRTLGAPTIGGTSESVDGATVKFSVDLTAVARDALGNGIRTYVAVFCTTNGTDWIERSLGSATRARTVLGAATLPNGVWTWYARASAESGGRTFAAESGTRTFRVFHNETPPAGFRRVDVTIAYDGEPAEDIPLLLRLSEAIEGFRYADVANDGKDFLFSDGDGNRLPFEIESWNPAGESLVWVRVPVFADGTVIHMDYGASDADGTADAADVWRRYVGVWHMGEPSGVVADATGHRLDATPAGNAENSVAIADGPVGTARRTATSAAKGYLSIPDYDRFGLGDTFAMSGWVKLAACTAHPRLFSRKNAYTDANGWEIEMNNGSKTAFVARGSGSSPSCSGTFDPALDAAWSRIVLVYDGPTLAVYQNGLPVMTNAIAAAKDNGLPLSIGCNSNGSETHVQGAFDECRLLDGVPTAAWIAAEHAAMAPLTNVVRFGAARRLEMPVLEDPPSLAWYRNGFVYSASVAYGFGDVLLTTVDLYDGSATTNATYSFDSAASLPQSFSDAVSLVENRMYRAVAVLRSSDGAEENFALARETVYSGQIAVKWIRDADVSTMVPAVMRLSRADTAAATCAPLEVSFALSGEAVSKGLLESVVSATIPAGTNCVDVEIRPIARSVVPGDYRATLTVAGTNVARPGSQGEFYVLHAGADPYVRYVAPNGDDGNDGALATTPKRTVASALASFSENARSSLCTVHLAPGLYPIDSPIVLTNAVRVLGDDPDPSRTIVSNTFAVGWENQNKRVFFLNHPDALVANLTMQKGQYYYSAHGGNFFVGAAGGTVSNCVVEAGWTAGNAQAAGAYLEGGLVTHSVFRKNRTGSGTAHWDGKWKGILYMKGKARAENCLFVDNPQTVPVVLIGLAGSSVMRNCTIADTGLSATNEHCRVFSALNVESQSATVQNVVVAGVTNTLDGAPCVPIGYVGRFRNCAVDGDVAGRGFPADTVVGTADAFFRNRARGDWRPKSGGPLVNAGAEYEPMAGVDLTGVQPRKVGTRVDIGCYEAFAETTILILR